MYNCMYMRVCVCVITSVWARRQAHTSFEYGNLWTRIVCCMQQQQQNASMAMNILLMAMNVAAAAAVVAAAWVAVTVTVAQMTIMLSVCCFL